MPIPCNLRISFSFASPDSADKLFPLTNLIALQTLTQERQKKKKKVLFTWILTFIPPASVQTFLKTGLFSFSSLSQLSLVLLC